MNRWSDKNAIMQIYPRSYSDSNNDGVGDLPGITKSLEYLKGSPESLRVDAIWISPFFPSPMKDFGYDVSDYQDVDPIFGSLDDFDDLITEAHERDIAVMIDFVPNHSSSEHQWFQEALTSRDSPTRDYYIFRDPKPDGTPPNNWLSVFGGSAWELHEETGQYYLHSFLREQPDLNWENPKVREAMADVLRFWFDKGVDGIRVDAIRWMGKDLEFRDDPWNEAFVSGQDPYHIVRHENSRFSPQLDDYIRCITAVAKEYENKIILLEDHLDDLTPIESQIKRIYSIDPGVAAPFNFQAMHIEFGARSFADTVNQYREFLPEGANTYYCFGNHDESRLATRFGERQARMLAVLQLTLPGTPVLYYGQELGMKDGYIPKESIRDPFELRVPDRGLGRDPERTPMQWDASHQAGFTAADTSWLPVTDSYKTVNVKHERKDPQSFLALHKRLLDLRDQHSVFVSTQYESEYVDDNLFVFWRADDQNAFLTVLNFSDYDVDYNIPEGGTVVVSAQNNDYEIIGPNATSIKPLDGLVIRYS